MIVSVAVRWSVLFAAGGSKTSIGPLGVDRRSRKSLEVN